MSSISEEIGFSKSNRISIFSTKLRSWSTMINVIMIVGTLVHAYIWYKYRVWALGVVFLITKIVA